jgi:sterol desaturase/sphingolipid hydroxylase (fatty acid hydroxylase superfamily)
MNIIGSIDTSQCERSEKRVNSQVMSGLYKAVINGKLGFAFVFTIAITITIGLILPNYHVELNHPDDEEERLMKGTTLCSVFTVLQSVLPTYVLSIYNPMVDHTVNLTALGALSGYYIMAITCTIVDLFSPLRWKTQDGKSFFSLKEWLQAIGVSTFNILCMSWFVLIPTWYVHKNGWFRSSETPLTKFSDDFHLSIEIVKQICHIFIIDIWFFTTHRLIHYPLLYKWIHKFHHQFTAPCAPACMYANPIEFMIGNVMGIIIGPCITNCHPMTTCFWLVYALVSTSCTHSGYILLGAQGHDWHHEHFHYNYGTNVFMDKLFATKFVGSKRWKLVMERRKKKEQMRIMEEERSSKSCSKLELEQVKNVGQKEHNKQE